MSEHTDADRLRHIAEEPEFMRFLYDMFGERGIKSQFDRLDAIRELCDVDIDDKANNRGAFAEISNV